MKNNKLKKFVPEGVYCIDPEKEIDLKGLIRRIPYVCPFYEVMNPDDRYIIHHGCTGKCTVFDKYVHGHAKVCKYKLKLKELELVEDNKEERFFKDEI